MSERNMEKKENFDIDFVIPWVDGADPEWKKQKDFYLSSAENPSVEATDDARFRDWDNLKYWFRGVEQFAPWVNKIHFITWGHLPKWLDVNHPKIHIVRHEDIIPKEFLPVFSSHVIETSLGKISGLSEHFVYFNDDIFILKPLSQQMFFRNGAPCCVPHIVNFVQYYKWLHFYQCIYLKNLDVINRNFNSCDTVRKHWRKFFNLKNGFQVIKDNFLSFSWRRKFFPGFTMNHAPNPFLRSVFEEVNEKESEAILEVYRHRFRSFDDVNQYLYLWWQMCEGKFYPSTEIDEFYLLIFGDITSAVDCIVHQKNSFICINDCPCDESLFYKVKERINNAFNTLLPEKSSFEI